MSPMPEKSANIFSRRMYVRLRRQDIAIFKFLLESCDNLAYLSIIDKHAAVLQVRYTPGTRQELLAFLDTARAEVDFTIVDDRD
ncbi:MAG: DUF4911 domain-containing protein [Thermodesulfobacteriota bacterium]